MVVPVDVVDELDRPYDLGDAALKAWLEGGVVGGKTRKKLEGIFYCALLTIVQKSASPALASLRGGIVTPKK